MPEPTQSPQPPAEPPGQRPDLRLVPAVAPPETDAEITGPIPVVPAAPEPPATPSAPAETGRAETGESGEAQSAVAPLAPLDVRILDRLGEILALRPHWSQRSPSSAAVFAYSTSGDWTAKEKSVLRVLHGLCVLAAFGVTYLPLWAIQVARCKPVGFVITLALLFVLSHIL